MIVRRLVYVCEFLPTYVFREIGELASRGIEIDVFLPLSTGVADRWKRVVRESGSEKLLRVHRDLPIHVLDCSPVRVIATALSRGAGAFLHHPVSFVRCMFRALSRRSFRYFVLGAVVAGALRGRPSLVHAHFAKRAAHAGLWAARMMGVPFTVTTHAVDIFRPDSEDRTLWLLREADGILTISEFNRNYIAKRYGSDLADRTTVTHLGLDPGSLPHRKLTANSPPRILCTASGLGEKKGVKVLVRSCQLLLERGVEFTCAVAGSDESGELLEEYREEARSEGLSGRVEFTGLLPSGRLLDTLAGCDLFVLPCIEAADGNMDGIPVALMEAMAIGIPAVSTRLSGIPELIDSGTDGMLVEPGDHVGLADAVEALLSDTELSRRLGSAGAGKVEREFGVALYADRLLEAWSRLEGPEG
jgi:colanic acid/amylovoran biosynthesis glycosyltransferase